MSEESKGLSAIQIIHLIKPDLRKLRLYHYKLHLHYKNRAAKYKKLERLDVVKDQTKVSEFHMHQVCLLNWFFELNDSVEVDYSKAEAEKRGKKWPASDAK